MKIQISFNYGDIDYRYTVNEEQAEMTKYDNVWCVGLFSRYNEFDPQKHMKETRDKDLFFKVVGDKRFINGKEIITADNIRILVFRESCPIGPIDFIKNDDGKTIGIQFV